MCGIAGVWRSIGEAQAEQLAAMAQSLQHRGPDDVGIWRRGPVGLAHRRLAILDLSAAGRQPMATLDGRWHIVFNGEIFNYRELARQYLPGYKFVSTSDTEVLLHLLARYGDKALPWLRGMFALALWDEVKKQLVLARDPFGKKPLYYWSSASGLWFASEPKALFIGAGEQIELNPAAVTQYFSYEYVPAPLTPWRGLQQVPMGTIQLWSSPQRAESKNYWRPNFGPKLEEGEATLLERLDALMRQSVERRLVSDVPVGLLLSGGLDSTTIGWYMKEADVALTHSFSVSFAERTFDESRWARLAAHSLGTNHHEIKFTTDSFFECLEELVPIMDVPLGDSSLLPTYAVSKLARQFVTVVLDGDGSDEIFAGYGTFWAAEAAERLQKVKSLIPALRWAAERLPTRYHDFSLDFKLKSFVRGLGLPVVGRNQVWLSSFTASELEGLVQPSWLHTGAVAEPLAVLQDATAGLSVINQVSRATIYQYLHNDILIKLDRATMATSLEARTPFLDIDVADFGLRLPDQYKRNKYLLKKLMRGRLPDAIVRRKKKGFGIPLGFWLKGPLYAWGREVLREDKVREDGILKWPAIEKLWDEHRSGLADRRKKLWTLLSWQLWYDQWVAKRPYRRG